MTYPGGTYPSVRGQPPHLARQYCLPASTSARRASSTRRFAPHITTTRSGSASCIDLRRVFPTAHFFQYGFGFVTAHSRDQAPLTRNETRKRCSRNRRANAFVHINRDSFFTFAAASGSPDEQPAVAPPGVAVSPAGSPLTGPPGYPIPHAGKGRLAPPSFCLPLVSGRSPSQAVGNLVRLSEGFGAATPCRLREPVKATVNHLPATEINGDDLGHSSVLKSTPALEASPT